MVSINGVGVKVGSGILVGRGVGCFWTKKEGSIEQAKLAAASKINR
jgi:hypothetical protein